MLLQVFKRKSNRWFTRDLGQDLVEFALILPLLLLLTIGTMDLARVVMTYNPLSSAAREGARYGIIHDHNDEGQIKAQALTLTTGTGVTAGDITVTRGGGVITVAVSHDTPLITGFLIAAAGGSNTLTLTATSQMRLE